MNIISIIIQFLAPCSCINCTKNYGRLFFEENIDPKNKYLLEAATNIAVHHHRAGITSRGADLFSDIEDVIVHEGENFVKGMENIFTGKLISKKVKKKVF